MCLKSPDQLRTVLDFAKKSGDRWHKAKAKFLGFYHSGVGGALIRSWHLPVSLQEAVAHHHYPASAKNFPIEAATVHLADIISHNLVLTRIKETTLITIIKVRGMRSSYPKTCIYNILPSKQKNS